MEELQKTEAKPVFEWNICGFGFAFVFLRQDLTVGWAGFRRGGLGLLLPPECWESPHLARLQWDLLVLLGYLLFV